MQGVAVKHTECSWESLLESDHLGVREEETIILKLMAGK
jgi:hypothetical protein